MHNPARRLVPRALGTALALLTLASATGPALAAEAIHFQRESYLGQLRHGQVHAVELHAQGRKVHAALNGGGHITATYPENGQAQVLATVRAKGVPVAVATSTHKTAVVHHKLRYIAGAVLIVAILVILVVLLIGRRRDLEDGVETDGGEAPSSARPPAGTG